MTQHHVNQANICAQFVISTIWCEMTVWAAPAIHFQTCDFDLTVGPMPPCWETGWYCRNVWVQRALAGHTCSTLPCDRLPPTAARLLVATFRHRSHLRDLQAWSQTKAINIAKKTRRWIVSQPVFCCSTLHLKALSHSNTTCHYVRGNWCL